jgi:GMP synthase-like glutamine amidotransferase
MKKLCVIQHTEAEYLGLIEDHFDGRNIRYVYKRPFTAGGAIPAAVEDFDGLVLLGGGPYGLVSGHLLPSFMAELKLTKAFLDAGLPVIGLELGSVILAVAAGGGAEEAPLRFQTEPAFATISGRQVFGLPEQFPATFYLRDRPVPPASADIVATDAQGNPLAFTVAGNSLGLVFHPGTKRGMMEDLVMEFDDTPVDTADGLDALGRAQPEIAEMLTGFMVGLCRYTRLL